MYYYDIIIMIVILDMLYFSEAPLGALVNTLLLSALIPIRILETDVPTIHYSIFFQCILFPFYISIQIEGRDECECKPAYILTFPSIPGEMQALATFKPRVNTIFQCSGNIGNYTIVSDPQTVNGTTLTCVARIQGV